MEGNYSITSKLFPQMTVTRINTTVDKLLRPERYRYNPSFWKADVSSPPRTISVQPVLLEGRCVYCAVSESKVGIIVSSHVALIWLLTSAKRCGSALCFKGSTLLTVTDGFGVFAFHTSSYTFPLMWLTSIFSLACLLRWLSRQRRYYWLHHLSFRKYRVM